ncbi:hypothetical protein EVC23_013 [Rhizobium phage RHph_N3_8]|uniref:hypothetical protein n=1 Tax=Rhizobium phage RHph_N3_8 TaxID=2509748 RepID=UPI001AF6E9F0|nr:hypothetical protein QEJ65_gp13 [Rhizobium phage RHph_N3_8]QIG76012.1 hypothetical protein EVC23_013 [Rhizobium phage RHph_N3_8]
MQLVTPNPNIPCKPGWCLQYVRETFGIAQGVYPTASSGWENAEFTHQDQNFPDAWVPLWFSMEGVPAGHVVLRSPGGKIWSTTNAGQYTPRIHPSLDDLLGVYERAGLALTYLGWSEDIEATRIWEEEAVALSEDELRGIIKEEIASAVAPGETGKKFAGPLYELADNVKWLREQFTTGEAGKRQAGEALRIILEAASKQ